MKIPLSSNEAVFREQKSKFIGILLSVSSKDEVRYQVDKVNKEYHNATHVCYAFRLYDENKGSIIEGKNDAGEPSGTAGEPILQQLQCQKIVNVVLIVVRYFGGIKLGKGGLARAYKACASLVIEDTDFCNFVPKSHLYLRVPYNLVGVVNNIVYKFNGEVISQEFNDTTTMEIYLPNDQIKEFKENIISTSSGKIEFIVNE